MSATKTECEECGAKRQTRKCDDCGRTASVIDCGHHAQPAEIAASKHDLSDTVCTECEEARDDAKEAAEAEAAQDARCDEANSLVVADDPDLF